MQYNILGVGDDVAECRASTRIWQEGGIVFDNVRDATGSYGEARGAVDVGMNKGKAGKRGWRGAESEKRKQNAGAKRPQLATVKQKITYPGI